MANDERLYKIIMRYKEELQKKIKEREEEMKQDNTDHYLIYNALGFTSKEGYQIDFQQNVGALSISLCRFIIRGIGNCLYEGSVS